VVHVQAGSAQEFFETCAIIPRQMGRLCTICAHPEHQAIDEVLKTARAFRDIGAQFGVSRAALHRHWQAHISGEASPPKPPPAQRRSGVWKWVVGVAVVMVAGGVGYVWWTSQ
jgi:hypothetical protein